MVCFIPTEYGPMAMRSDPVHAHFVGVLFPANVKLDVVKNIMSHALDTAYLILQKSLPWAQINDFVTKIMWALI